MVYALGVPLKRILNQNESISSRGISHPSTLVVKYKYHYNRSFKVLSTHIRFPFSQVIITDPTAEEENLSSSIINIAASKGNICFVRKPGGMPLSESQMDKLFKQALDREIELLKILNDCFSEQNHTINQME